MVKMNMEGCCLSMEPVTIYVTEGCGSCRQMKELLTSRGVSYIEKNTTTDPGLMDELNRLGSSTVPTVVFGEHIVIGLRPNLMNRLLDEAGL